MNVGTIAVTTEIPILNSGAHCPPFGTKVYSDIPATVVETVAGLQVPVIPLVEAVGKTGAVEFRCKGPICLNVGKTLKTTTSSFTTVAFCPASGVKT
jgi:hypothetical protein